MYNRVSLVEASSSLICFKQQKSFDRPRPPAFEMSLTS